MALSIGIDIGNATSCVALAKGSAVDVVLNRDGQRETPTAMYYGNTARTVGLKSYSRFATQPRSTVVQVKRLIGRIHADLREAGMLLYDVIDGAEQQQGHCIISVPAPPNISSPPLQLRPEQVMATVLKQLSETAASNAGAEISKHVLSIPCFYGQAERASMLAAAEVAGLTDVSLIHELTATALCWGVAKRNLPDEQPKHVAFVDVGHSATQVCIAAFTKSRFEILAHSWDGSCGGRDMDAMLVSHFADEFMKTSGLNVRNNRKALAKMTLKVAKCRELLTGSKSAQIHIDSLMNDTDFSGTVTVEGFEQLCTRLMARVESTLQSVLSKARLCPSDIKIVERVGGASRTPAVVRVIQKVFQLEKSSRQPKSTMNHKECVARGCALWGAMLLGHCKGQVISVKDVYPFEAQGRYVTPDGGKIRVINVLKSGQHLGQTDGSAKRLLAFTADRSMEVVSGELVVHDDISDGQLWSSQGTLAPATVHLKLSGTFPPAVCAEGGLLYQFAEWQVCCSRDDNGVFHMMDHAMVVYRACAPQGTLPATYSCGANAKPPLRSQSAPESSLEVYRHPVQVRYLRTVPPEMIHHWANVEKQMEADDQQHTKVEQARNDLEGCVHECDSRLRCEWNIAVQHADHTIRNLKYHLEEARWAIGYTESNPEVYLTKLKALREASETLCQRVENMQQTSYTHGTDGAKPGSPPGQLPATEDSLAAQQVMAHPISVGQLDSEYEPSPLQDKVNEFICTLSALDYLWLDSVSETTLGVVLTDWLDHTMQSFTRTLETLCNGASEASCGPADTVAAEHMQDEAGESQIQNVVSQAAQHRKRHIFCKAQSGTADSGMQQQ